MRNAALILLSLTALLGQTAALQEPAWEARSVLGFEQTAASSSDSRRNYLFDFYINRALGNDKDPTNAAWIVWGNVRLATVPIQQNPTFTSLAASPAAALVTLKANQLVQSGEFQSGLEFRPRKFLWKNTSLNRARTLGLIVGIGASAPFDPKQSVALFSAPTQTAQLFAAYSAQLAAQGFTPTHPPLFLAFTPPDRDQFYRQWLTGFRISTFDLKTPANPPATYSVTLGQDELVTGGALTAKVVRFEVFYPLPVNLGGLNLIYLFGSANLRASTASTNTTPLFLDPAAPGVTPTTPGTAILVTTSKRDYYHVGIGIDLLNALRQLKIGAKSLAADERR